MAALWINAFVARETEAAYGVAPCARGTFDVASLAFLWIPKGKVAESDETNLMDKKLTMKGESLERNCTPMTFLVDSDFLEKVKALDYAFE